MRNAPNPAAPQNSPRYKLTTLLKFSALSIVLIFISFILLTKDLRIPILKLQLSLLLITVALATSYILIPPSYQFKINELRLTVIYIYRSLTVEQKLYINSAILALAIIFVFATAGPMLGIPTMILSLAFFGFVAIRDVLRWYKSMSEHPLGKAVIAIGFAVASNLAYAFANQLVSQVVHVTPMNFLRTTLFIAILMIPVLMVLAGGIAFAIGSGMSSVIIMLSAGPNLDQFRNWLFAGTWPVQTLRFAFATRLLQLLFYLTIFAAISAFGGSHFKWYETKLLTLIPGLVYNLDMYAAKECKLGEGFKSAPLGDAKFLIAQQTASGIQIQPPVKCDDLPTTESHFSN